MERTHLADGEHNMALEGQHDSFGESSRAGLGAAEPCDLEHRGNGERAHFPVELEDGRVRGHARAKGLVVQEVHAFRGEAMLPGVDWRWVSS